MTTDFYIWVHYLSNIQTKSPSILQPTGWDPPGYTAPKETDLGYTIFPSPTNPARDYASYAKSC